MNFKVNVWVGIVNNFLLGPVFLPPRLNVTLNMNLKIARQCYNATHFLNWRYNYVTRLAQIHEYKNSGDSIINGI